MYRILLNAVEKQFLHKALSSVVDAIRPHRNAKSFILGDIGEYLDFHASLSRSLKRSSRMPIPGSFLQSIYGISRMVQKVIAFLDMKKIPSKLGEYIRILNGIHEKLQELADIDAQRILGLITKEFEEKFLALRKEVHTKKTQKRLLTAIKENPLIAGKK